MQPSVPVRQPFAGVDFIPQSGIFEFGYRAGRRKSYSKDILLQHHDATTPAIVGPTNAETLATAWVPATTWTRARSGTPVTLGKTAEETPATS
jgi:hypothetical protein